MVQNEPAFEHSKYVDGVVDPQSPLGGWAEADQGGLVLGEEPLSEEQKKRLEVTRVMSMDIMLQADRHQVIFLDLKYDLVNEPSHCSI